MTIRFPRKLVPIISGFIALIMIQGCFLIKPVEPVAAEHLDIRPAGDKAEIRFDLVVKNPNNFSVRVLKMDCKLLLADSLLGILQIMEDLRVTRNETVRLPISFYPNLVVLGKLALSTDWMLNLKSGGKGFEVQGELKLRKFIFTRKLRWSENVNL